METCLSSSPSRVGEDAQQTRVLIIGNELASLHLKKWLEDELVIIEPTEYANAVSFLETFNPDVVVASLSGKDPFEFEIVKLITQKIEKVLVVSGAFECHSVMSDAIALGAKGYVGQKSKEQFKAAFGAVKAGNYCYGVEFALNSSVLPYLTQNFSPDATKLHQINCLVAHETIERWIDQTSGEFLSNGDWCQQMGISYDEQALIVIDELASLPDGNTLFERLEVYLKAFLENNANYSSGVVPEPEMEKIANSINTWLNSKTPGRFNEGCRGVLEENARSRSQRQFQVFKEQLALHLPSCGIQTLLNRLTSLQKFLAYCGNNYEALLLEYKLDKESDWRTYVDLRRSLIDEKAPNSIHTNEYSQGAWKAFCLSFINQLRAEIIEVALVELRNLIEQIEKFIKAVTATNALLLSLLKGFELEIASMPTSEFSQIRVSMYLDRVDLERLRHELEKEFKSGFPLWGINQSISLTLRYKLLALVQPISLKIYQQSIRELLD